MKTSRNLLKALNQKNPKRMSIAARNDRVSVHVMNTHPVITSIVKSN